MRELTSQVSLNFGADIEGFLSPRWHDAAVRVCEQHGLSHEGMARAASTDHVVFLAAEHVIKIFHGGRDCFERERRALEFCNGRLPIVTPAITGAGTVDAYDYLITRRVAGSTIRRPEFLQLSEENKARILQDLAVAMRAMHELDASEFDDDWASFVSSQASTVIERQISHGVNSRIIAELPRYIADNLPLVPRASSVFMHADIHLGNLNFISSADGLQIAGLFDFADSRRAYFEYDFLAACVLILQGEGCLQREFFRAYGFSDSDLDEEMRTRLMMLTILYETADLRRYALRLGNSAVDLDLKSLERAIWNFC